MFKSVVSYGITVVILNIALVKANHPVPAKFTEFSADCIKDYPVTSDDLTFFKQKVFPESDHAGCFAACIFKKAGMFDDNGILSHTAFENAKVFEDEESAGIKEFLTTCATVNDEDVSDGELGCERAKLAFNCFAENHEKFNFDLCF